MALPELTESFLATVSTERSQQEFYDDSFVFGGSFGVRVSRSGRRVFFLIRSSGGRRKRVTLGTYPLVSLAEARAAALRVLRSGETDNPPERFSELCDLFLSRNTFSATTGREYRRIIAKELLPAWGDRRIDQVSRADIIHLLDRVAVERESQVMSQRIGALISKLFSFALERALIDAHPARRLAELVETERVEPIEKPLLGKEDIAGFWTATESEPFYARGALRLLLLTGAQPGEIAGLRWKDVEFDRMILSTGTKTRAVPLSPQALQLLRSAPSGKRGEFVFEPEPGKKLLNLRKAMSRVSRKMNGAPSWSCRDLRKTVEGTLRGLRVRPDVIEEVLGRHSYRTFPRRATTDDYQSDVRQALELWGRKIAEYTKPKTKDRKGPKVIPLFPE